MSGVKQGDSYTYVAQLGYDKFEQRVFVENGNNTETRYEYDPDRRRLSHLDTRNLAGRTFIDNDYAYNLVNNISGITNKAPVPSHLQLGGSSRYEFTYDNLYRLSGAKGVWTGANRRDTFALSMTYDSLHNITRKNQLHLRDSMPQPETHYDNTYLYAGPRPHTPGKVGGILFTYDANGNLTEQRGENYFDFQQMIWDEENRLMGVSNNGYLSRYTYDAGGERVLKSHGGIQGVFIDGAPAGVVNHRNNYTAYISPYLVAREHSFTKHYYVEGQRIASKTGTGKFYNQHWFNRGITAGGRNYTQRMQELQKAANAYYYDSLHIAPGPPTLPGYYAQPEITGAPIPQLGLDSAYIYAPAGWPQPPAGQAPGPAPGAPTLPYNSAVTNETVPAGYAFFGDGQFNFEGNQFFYHPDHLGSSSYITDINGTVRQHLEYLPFGETFVDEHSNSDVQPYLFNAKELDTETGLYYYGARYYDPKISMWASVDPLAEKYAGWSPYNYTLLNPVKYVDPDGRAVFLAILIPYAPIIISAGAEAFSQLYDMTKNDFDIDKHSSIKSAGKIMFNGALAAVGGKNPVSDFAADVLGNTFIDIVGEEDISIGKVGKSLLDNTISSTIGLVSGKLAGKSRYGLDTGKIGTPQQLGGKYKGKYKEMTRETGELMEDLGSTFVNGIKNLIDFGKGSGKKNSQTNDGHVKQVLEFDPLLIEVKKTD
jgi:RHS repeat-associated protein